MEIKYLALRRILRSVFRLLFKLLARVEAMGLENIPTEGGLILAVNHLSILDPPFNFFLGRAR
jgi:1-acyl-sn-glycerol-3-phosphate acyltransferase